MIEECETKKQVDNFFNSASYCGREAAIFVFVWETHTWLHLFALLILFQSDFRAQKSNRNVTLEESVKHYKHGTTVVNLSVTQQTRPWYLGKRLDMLRLEDFERFLVRSVNRLNATKYTLYPVNGRPFLLKANSNTPTNSGCWVW